MTADISNSQKQMLLKMAKAVRDKSYSPYSAFKVGAAILFDSGEIVCACNVENASYGASLCAERNAMGSGISKGLMNPVAIAIAGKNGIACPPCGICRQFLMEFNPNMAVILENDNVPIVYLLKDLLPAPFSPTELDMANERQSK